MHSLYGSTAESLRPRPEWLEGLDVVVFDIQDVGARYYTYVYTLALAMEACARAGVRFVVLDRPNPLGGERAEGNLVEPGFESFVGLYPLPNRHGMTLGELARMLNAEQRFGCDLAVVPCLGWSRRMGWQGQKGMPCFSSSFTSCSRRKSTISSSGVNLNPSGSTTFGCFSVWRCITPR